ncbi:MAG: DJ-1/PfpI family protein [Clostridia bacterium]|nr:DJ-1/PfpI family protein [Clostridia bacterium]
MVYLFLANGFEEIEALTPVDMLRRAGIDVTTVSINETTLVSGAHGIQVVADTTADKIAPVNIDAVILPGGLPGADNLRMNETVNLFIDTAAENGKLLCAICAAPRILGEKGLVKGKKATCFPGFETYLDGALVDDYGCVRDGNVITAKSMGKAVDFSVEIISALKDAETAQKIKNSIFA